MFAVHDKTYLTWSRINEAVTRLADRLRAAEGILVNKSCCTQGSHGFRNIKTPCPLLDTDYSSAWRVLLCVYLGITTQMHLNFANTISTVTIQETKHVPCCIICIKVLDDSLLQYTNIHVKMKHSAAVSRDQNQS